MDSPVSKSGDYAHSPATLIAPHLCSLFLPHLVKVLIAPRNTTQNQKSTTMPQSSRVGSLCCAPGGRYGISRKYTAFPATTAIRDWTKFAIAGLDTGGPENQQSALSNQHSANSE